jgi:hypothetical protein
MTQTDTRADRSVERFFGVLRDVFERFKLTDEK